LKSTKRRRWRLSGHGRGRPNMLQRRHAHGRGTWGRSAGQPGPAAGEGVELSPLRRSVGCQAPRISPSPGASAAIADFRELRAPVQGSGNVAPGDLTFARRGCPLCSRTRGSAVFVYNQRGVGCRSPCRENGSPRIGFDRRAGNRGRRRLSCAFGAPCIGSVAADLQQVAVLSSRVLTGLPPT